MSTPRARRAVSLLAGLVGAAVAVWAGVTFGHAPAAPSRLLALVGAAGFALGALPVAVVRRERVGGALGVAALVGSGAVFVAAPSAPGVLLVVVDCLGADRFTPALMPHTWALTDSAYRFAHARAQSSWTRSSVPSILTGRWPNEHGLYRLKPAPDRLRPGVPTLGTWFHEAGWATAVFADQAQLDPAFGLAEGFDRYQWRDGAAPALLGRHARWHRFFRHAPRFVWLHLLDIHKPFTPDPAFLPADLPPTALALGPDTDWPALMREINTGARTLSDADWAHLEALHEAEVRQLDVELGRLWAALAADGTLDSSWLVLTADHGEAFGEHGWFTHGGAPHAELVEIPLLVRPPGGLAEGRLVDGAPRQIDLAPTILAAAGLPVPPGLPGVDLRPVWEGRAAAPEVSIAEYDGEGQGMIGVRDARWSWLSGPDGERLYDLAADPDERVDVAAAHPEEAARLRALAGAYRAAGSGGGEAASGTAAGTLEGLRALGYLE